MGGETAPRREGTGKVEGPRETGSNNLGGL